MAVLETHAIGGGAQLTLFSAVSGDADEGSRRFAGLGERGYSKEAEKQGKMRGHLSLKGVVGTQTTLSGDPGKPGHPIINRKCLGLWMQRFSEDYMAIMKFLPKNRLSGPQNAL